MSTRVNGPEAAQILEIYCSDVMRDLDVKRDEAVHLMRDQYREVADGNLGLTRDFVRDWCDAEIRILDRGEVRR